LFFITAVLGNAHGADLDTRSEETDIDEPLSPSAREIGFSFCKNTSSSLSALAQSPLECLSPSKEEALKDELSPVTEVPSDIRKLKFNIGASPSDFILKENENEEVQQHQFASVKHSEELFKPISESGESDELETVVERTKPEDSSMSETVDQSLKSTETDVACASRDAGDSSDEERDVVDDGSSFNRMTLLSFDNIAYEDPVEESDLQGAHHADKQVPAASQSITTKEESSGKHSGRHHVSISSDSDSEKLIDAEMVDIQSTLQTQFESTPASKLAESLGFGEFGEIQYGDEEECQPGVLFSEPHESIRGTHDAEVLSTIESQRTNIKLTSGADEPGVFSISHEASSAVGRAETGNVAGTLMVSDDIMKTSTSSDASAEATILAATYDLDLGAVSRVVATYDMSPDSVDKSFVIDKQSKVLQSSPDDEVFETEGGAKTAPKAEDSSEIAESDFDANEMPFELVKADDVDGYEAYLEVMQQNRTVADEELGELLHLHVCHPETVDESSSSVTAEASSPMSSAVNVQPDLIQGIPLNINVRSSSAVPHQSGELVTIDDDEGHEEDHSTDRSEHVSQHFENLDDCSTSWNAFQQLKCDTSACEDTGHVLASFGKGALESDNMYRVFQQDTSSSPGDDDAVACSEDTYRYFGSETDDETVTCTLKYRPQLDQDEDFDSDFLAEASEPELMALSAEKEDEECDVEVNLLECSDDSQLLQTGSSGGWTGVDTQCFNRPLSPLPDSAYRIVDNTDDAYVAMRARCSTADSEAGIRTPETHAADDDNMHSKHAAVIVSHVVVNAKAAAENIADPGNGHLQDMDIDEGFFQVENIPDLAPKDVQSPAHHEEVDDVDEGVLPEDDHQLYEDENVDYNGLTGEAVKCHSEEHVRGDSETASSGLVAQNLLDFDGESVHDKASEFVNSLVKEAQVEAEDNAYRPQETDGKSMTEFTLTSLREEASGEFNAVFADEVDFERGEDSEIGTSDIASSGVVSSEDTALLCYEQTESSKSESEVVFEWNGIEQTSLEDYGDSSSVDSFATVVPSHQEVAEDRMEDLASVSSSFHSDLYSSYVEDQPDPMVCVDARDEDFMHEGETDDSSSSEQFEGMRDDLDSSVVEMVTCYESPDDDKYGILDDDFDQPMMMLATINEEDERSSTSGKSGKTASSSERVDGTSESDKQASSGELHAEYPCRRMVGKSSDKDDVSVSSSLLEFETLEKEMQERTSLDSLSKLGSQHSVADRHSEASSSLLEFERIEKEMQERTSHDSLTKLGSLSSVAEKDNVSVSSSLAEFERLEKEIEVTEPSNTISVHTTYGMAGSTTSLNAFLMDDTAHQVEPAVPQSAEHTFAFHDQFEAEAQAVVSMLEAGALPVLHGHTSLHTEFESGGASVEPMPAAVDEGEYNKNDTELPVYPEYQDIVQIIRKASETAQENVEGEGKRSLYRPDLHEPDVDSLNERDDAEDAALAAEARVPDYSKDVDNDSLQDEDDTQMYSDQVVPSCGYADEMFPAENPDEGDVMETSADSIEGVREETALNRSADSLELRASLAHNPDALMQQSVDSLSAADDAAGFQLRDSFDADSLHESSALAVSGGEQTYDDSRQAIGLLMASVESGAWSQSDSLLSNNETLKSSDDNVLMSPESPNTSMKRDSPTTEGDSRPDSCYCHTADSPGSSLPECQSQDENHSECMSGNYIGPNVVTYLLCSLYVRGAWTGLLCCSV